MCFTLRQSLNYLLVLSILDFFLMDFIRIVFLPIIFFYSSLLLFMLLFLIQVCFVLHLKRDHFVQLLQTLSNSLYEMGRKNNYILNQKRRKYKIMLSIFLIILLILFIISIYFLLTAGDSEVFFLDYPIFILLIVPYLTLSRFVD